MAQLCPASLPTPQIAPSLARELESLERMKRDLPSSFAIYHGVHWSRAWAKATAFGEADFIIVSGTGDCLIVELKTGALEEGPKGLEKRYDGKTKSVSSQLLRTIDALRDKFKVHTGHSLSADYLLYCPDYRVRNLAAAGIDASRILDGSSKATLTERVLELLVDAELSDQGRRTQRFFEQTFDLIPDIHARVSFGERCFIRSVGGLSDTVAAISGRPLRLAVRGTAGCGKSLVALRAFRDLEAQGKRPLLLCYNRDLKEKMKVAAGSSARGVVETFQGAIAGVLEATDRPLDHGTKVDWNRAVDHVLEGTMPDKWRFDAVIVDEGQDFVPGWRDMLDLFGADTGDCVWLDDPDQAIQFGLKPDISPWPRPEWTGFRAKANYRSPASIAQYLKQLLPEFEFENANALPGLGVCITEVSDDSDLPKAVGRIASDLMKRGFKRDQIVALSLRGQGSATLSRAGSAGSLAISRFTGTYDLFGNQQWTDGHLRFDTIRRFKGQQSAAVIITDCDRPAEDEREAEWRRLLFVALTRATERVELVVTKASATSALLHDAL